MSAAYSYYSQRMHSHLRSHYSRLNHSFTMPIISFSCSILSLLVMASNYAYALDSSEMQRHLAAGAPLLGTYTQSADKLTSWMSTSGDSTTIESLSIPGTHDSLACGFSRAERWPFSNASSGRECFRKHIYRLPNPGETAYTRHISCIDRPN